MDQAPDVMGQMKADRFDGKLKIEGWTRHNEKPSSELIDGYGHSKSLVSDLRKPYLLPKYAGNF